jgi:hypothetical protein
VRRAIVPDSVVGREIEILLDDRLTSVTTSEAKDRLRGYFANVPYAKIFPASEPRLVVDALDRIWLAEYRRPSSPW